MMVITRNVSSVSSAPYFVRDDTAVGIRDQKVITIFNSINDLDKSIVHYLLKYIF